MTENLTANILDIASRLPDNWLISGDSRKIGEIRDRIFHQLTQNQPPQTPQKVFIAESEPIQFIASFIAACVTKSHIFLCNPNWVKSEWEQVFDLVQPDLILGQVAELEKRFPFPKVRAGGLRSCARVASEFHSPEIPEINELPSIMIPTGGSSGKIRFAIHTWDTLTASVQGFQEYFQVYKINSFCTLPLYHVSGLMQFMRSFTSGGQLAIQPFKELETGKKSDIEPEKFFISLVPTQLKSLLQNPDTANWLSRFHTVLLGGAPAWPELLEIARKYQIKLAPTYGITETASQIATLKPEDFLSGNNSSGQILPHAQVTIRGLNGEILCYNKIGNIAVNTKSLALGYYPEKLVNREYCQLDDLGFFDKNNYLNIVGRNSDKIITGGENVFPIEVEAAIRRTNLVADVAVIGLLDQHWGQAVTAIYVPANSEVTVKTLQSAIEDKLSKFKRPKNWILVEDLPRNSQGKINREQLQQIAMKYQ
jgi:o-succinylbenzoate---CoA ligase